MASRTGVCILANSYVRATNSGCPHSTSLWIKYMPAFNIIALGCGGGPDEHNLSCYLFKPHEQSWNDGIFALDAGSSIGALNKLLAEQPELFDMKQITGSVHVSHSASEVYSWIRNFIITHAHLDHVNGMVLSAGSMGGPSRSVIGAHRCLQDIESIFSGRIWPKLASWSEADSLPLTLTPLPDNGQYTSIAPSVSIRMMPISHGQHEGLGTYWSSAFFIRHDPSAREFLFFGDVEPDSIAAEPRNRNVWRSAAEKIPEQLNTIFIECSWPSGRADDRLYGHLSPEHLCAELTVLACEVSEYRKRALVSLEHDYEREESHRARKRQRKRLVSGPPSLHGALNGVRVYVTHCKEDNQGDHQQPIHKVIADQVQRLVDAQQLDVEIFAVEQGMHILI